MHSCLSAPPFCLNRWQVKIQRYLNTALGKWTIPIRFAFQYNQLNYHFLRFGLFNIIFYRHFMKINRVVASFFWLDPSNILSIFDSLFPKTLCFEQKTSSIDWCGFHNLFASAKEIWRQKMIKPYFWLLLCISFGQNVLSIQILFFIYMNFLVYFDTLDATNSFVSRNLIWIKNKQNWPIPRAQFVNRWDDIPVEVETFFAAVKRHQIKT